jgi:hypothetical protein
MRKIDATDYEVTLPDGKKIAYLVRQSLADVLLAPQLKLNGTALLRNNILATKIISSKDSFIFFEEAEWIQLTQALNIIEGWSHNDVEFVRRILESPKVEVTEKIGV